MIAFLVTEDMVDFLNVRGIAAGSRSEYLRHLVLQDMFGGQSEFQIKKDRKEQIETLPEEEMKKYRNVRNELKSALSDGINGLLTKVEDDGNSN